MSQKRNALKTPHAQNQFAAPREDTVWVKQGKIDALAHSVLSSARKVLKI